MALPNGDSAETQRLLAQVRAGAPSAVESLLARHRPYLLRLVLAAPPELLPLPKSSDE